MSWTVLAFTWQGQASSRRPLSVWRGPGACRPSRVDLNEVLKSSGASAPRSRLGGLGASSWSSRSLTVSMVLARRRRAADRKHRRADVGAAVVRVADVVTANVALPARAFLQTEQRSQALPTPAPRVAALPASTRRARRRRTPLIGSEAAAR